MFRNQQNNDGFIKRTAYMKIAVQWIEHNIDPQMSYPIYNKTRKVVSKPDLVLRPRPNHTWTEAHMDLFGRCPVGTFCAFFFT